MQKVGSGNSFIEHCTIERHYEIFVRFIYASHSRPQLMRQDLPAHSLPLCAFNDLM